MRRQSGKIACEHRDDVSLLRRGFTRTLEPAEVREMCVLRRAGEDAAHRLAAVVGGQLALLPADLHGEALAECRSISDQLRGIRQELQFHYARTRLCEFGSGDDLSVGSSAGSTSAERNDDELSSIELEVLQTSLEVTLLLNDTDGQLSPILSASRRMRRRLRGVPGADAAVATFFSLDVLYSTFEGGDRSGEGAQVVREMDGLCEVLRENGQARVLVTTAVELAGRAGCVADFIAMAAFLSNLRSERAAHEDLRAAFFLIDLLLVHLTYRWCAQQQKRRAEGGADLSGSAAFRPSADGAIAAAQLAAIAHARPWVTREDFEAGRTPVDPTVLPPLPGTLLHPIVSVMGLLPPLS